MRFRTAVTAGALLAAALAGCGGSSPISVPPFTPPTSAGTVSSPAPAAAAPTRHLRRHRTSPEAPAPTPTAASRRAAAPFFYTAAAVTAASLGKSWHDGCPVGPASLRAVTMRIWGFDGRPHTGVLVINAGYVTPVVAAFRAMYEAHFPIRQMQPIATYGGNDNRSMAADNTSGFNCRYAVSNGPKHWSMHAYGEAVDIDPLENPYKLDGKVLPPQGATYLDRSNVRRGMIVAGSEPVQAFSTVGWGWGGNWSSSPDYQHFSSTGQ